MISPDLRRRVGRHDDDEIDLALPQPAVSLGRVGDDLRGARERAASRLAALRAAYEGFTSI